MESGSRYTNTGSGPARTFAEREAGAGRNEDSPPPYPAPPGQPATVPVTTGPAHVGEPVVEAAPDEPLALVAVGPAGAGRDAVVAALLDVDESVLGVPEGTFLVLRHGPEGTGSAYVPGYREPHAYGTGPTAAGPALARPPRRVELTLPQPLLRRFDVVDASDSGELGPAGVQVLLDVVDRAGGLLFVISAEQTLTGTDLDLLTEVARSGARVFFVVTPGEDGWPTPGEVDPATDADHDAGLDPAIGYVLVDSAADPIQVILDAHRAALLAAIPSLAGADWLALDPGHEDPIWLRRALAGWAEQAALHRAAANPPVPRDATRTVPVAETAHDSDWADWLDREVHQRAHRLRQHLALELANIHLRCVQELVFGGGCRALPGALDRELHALSLHAVAESDRGVERILTETLTRVFGEPPDEAVRRRVAVAVRWGLVEERGGRELDRVLLVTSTGGVAAVTGAAAVAALAVYPGELGGVVLPPIGAALSGGCYQHWRNPSNADVAKARSWLQRALREVELELARELTRRFEAVQESLGAVLNDAVDHGILLA